MKRGRPPYPGLLTPREQEVLALLRQGLSNAQIAERLHISVDGVKFHVSEIISRLGVESRLEAAAWQPTGGSRIFGLAAVVALLKRSSVEGGLRMATKSVLVAAVLAFTLLAIGALVALSRGGGSSGPGSSSEALANEPMLDVLEADALLHTALPSPGDFPGTGWTVTGDDRFDSGVAPVPACEPLEALFDRIETESVARAQRRLEAESGPSVEITLFAFATSDIAADMIEQRRTLTDEQIAACLTENVKRERLDSTASVTPTTALAVAPHDGSTFAGDIDFKAPNDTRVAVHGEIFSWRQGNVYVHLMVVGLPGADLSTLNSAATQAVAVALDAVMDN